MFLCYQYLYYYRFEALLYKVMTAHSKLQRASRKGFLSSLSHMLLACLVIWLALRQP